MATDTTVLSSGEGHPQHQQLLDWLSGHADEVTAGEISEHVSQCLACEQIVQQIENEQPPIFRYLRDSGGETQLVSDKLAVTSSFVSGVSSFDVDDRNRTRVSGSTHQREFLPGERVANRYRIVSLIGRGGMGEVYRAEDMRLGQPVALKFLSSRTASSEKSLRYFLQEVRLSQRLSHPHICRVHDLVEADSLRFLSMEFIEGEDLQGLLSRLGSLPPSKATELARQLCQGLASAHHAGVLHRDLKPSNIMIDQQGRARITDFGLAREHNTVNPTEGIVGTPRYMAPEQLSENQTSVQSDLYALALIIFEMYTGRTAQPGKTLDDIRDLHQSNAACEAALAAVEIPAEIGVLLAACLAQAPKDRPESVSELARGLPGQTAMEEAIATGSTLSPELLAISGPKGSLPIRWRAGLMASVLIALCCGVLLSSQTMRTLGKLDSPPRLLDQAKQVIGLSETQSLPGSNESAGAEVSPQRPYFAWGYQIESEALDWARNNAVETKSKPPAFLDAVTFWYRDSDEVIAPLVPDWSGENFLRVDPSRPPPGPGSRLVRLSPDGQLRFFEYIIRDAAWTPPANIKPIDWDAFFMAAGLSPEQIDRLVETQADHVPRGYSDQRHQWTLTPVENESATIRFEAASLASVPTLFRVVGPWSTPPASRWAGSLRLHPIVDLIALIWLPIMFVATAYFARKNLYAKRADLAGANRVAIFAGASPLTFWLVGGAHVTSSLEMDLLLTALAASCMTAVMVWANYLAFEPVVRREYPGTLVSWSRLLEGHFRDPLIGRHLLIGIAAGTAVGVGKLSMVTFPMLLGLPPADAANAVNLIPLAGGRVVVGEVLTSLGMAIFYSVFYQLLLLVLLRLLLRKMIFAVAVFVFFMAIRVAIQYDPFWFSIGVSMLEFGLTAFLFLRVGLLSVIAMHFARLMMKWPLVTDDSAWFSPLSWGCVFIVIGVAIAGVVLCRPLKPNLEGHSSSRTWL